MASVADFAPFVELKVRHAPTPNVHHAVRESLVQFMQMSRSAVDEVYIEVPCNEAEVIIPPSGCKRLLQVEDVFLSPVCDGRSRWSPEWETINQTERNVMQGQMNFGGPSYGWWMDDVGGPNSTMWLYPRDRRAKRLCIRYSWSLKRDDCTVPDWIYEDYADVIADGAVSLLHTNPTDPDVSVPFGFQMGPVFLEGVARARRRKEVQYRTRRLKQSNRQFYGG